MTLIRPTTSTPWSGSILFWPESLWRCAFLLGRIAASVNQFKASADANPGPLEEGLDEPLRHLKASILERAAQQKSDWIAPTGSYCGTKLIWCGVS